MVVVEMKKEKQVVSLELAKRLKKLGVKQNSQWYWEIRIFQLAPDWMKNTPDAQLMECDYEKKEDWKHYKFEYYSTFTVAELGEILPYYVHSYKEDARSGRWCCDEGDKQCFSDTEANARAKMLIYLVECNKIQRAKT